MKIRGKQSIEIEISKEELAYAIMQVIRERLSDVDDAGCDWMTNDTVTFIGDENWIVSYNPHIAILVDAMNILRYDQKLGLDK